RAHEGCLKTLITEPTLHIEPKGVDAFTVPNCLHIIMASNNDWVVPAGANARRFFVLDVSTKHMQDTDYFAAIEEQMERGGNEALLDILLRRNLSSFNVRKVPQTGALAVQKAFSRRGVDQLIESLAMDGSLPSPYHEDPGVTLNSGMTDGSKGFFL